MTFELTESILSQILFAMENQTEEYALIVKISESGSENVEIIPFSELNIDLESSDSINPEDVYSLPKWYSSDGFNLLEEFTETVFNLKIKTELKKVLTNGRGVFKNFKNVLKNHSEIEKRFYLFKENQMKNRVSEWYNSLRESWGLDKLEKNVLFETESFDDLVYEDFIFREYDFSADGNCVILEHKKIFNELKEEYPDEIGLLFSNLWNQKRDFENYEGFVCRTLSDEFAGCVLFQVDSHSPTVARESVTLTTCFVNMDYRGLGIAKKLFSLCVSSLKERGFSTFVIADLLIPQSFERFLTELGFKRIRSAFVAKYF